VTIAAVGDVMLGRYVGQRIAKLGPTYPFSATTALLAADLTLGNLESPLTARRAPALLRPGPYRLPADPAAVAGLTAAGFDALSLANNHGLDAGPEGIREASETLESAGIAALGAGPDAAAARRYRMVDVQGWHIALVAANAVHDPEDQPDEGSDWGRAWLDAATLDSVAAARRDADLVVALIHWGSEYTLQPNARQRSQAAALVAAGADLVLGAHPHVLQPIETIRAGGRSGLVAFSLGNFVFDQSADPATTRSAVLRISVGSGGVLGYTIAPVTISYGQPRPLPPEDPAYAAVLRELGQSSAGSATPRPAPVSTATPSGAGGAPTGLSLAFRWNGATFAPIAPPDSAALRLGPTTLLSATADLRGNGIPMLLTVTDGVAQLRDGPGTPVLWQNEVAGWWVAGAVPGDFDGDGRAEFLLLLWQPDATGTLRSHPFLLGWRGGRYRIIWGGSAVSPPIQAAALGDVDGDGAAELVVLEGGNRPGDTAATVAVLRWHSWSFARIWRSSPGIFTHLELVNRPGDGIQEIIVGL
jgi:poly-gamma-glutamate synthesis protein (capsule biosynthesis protein)